MRNLLGRLHQRSPASLAGIARFWGVDLRGRDVHQDVGQLFRVMTDPWSFAIAAEHLQPVERDFLRRLIATDGTRSGHDIAAEFKSDYADIRETLRTLYRAGFLFAEQAEMGVDDDGEARLLVPREIIGLTRRIQDEQSLKDPDECSLAELIDRLDDAELAEIAEHLGYTVIPTVALRADLVEYVRPRLADEDRLARLRENLEWPESALFEALQQDGRCYPDRTRSALGLTMTQLRDAIWELVIRGLIWRGYDEDGQLQIVCPTEIRVPTPVPKAPEPELVTIPAGEVDEPEWIYPYPAAWDLLTVLRETQIARTQALARMLRDGGQHLSAAATERLSRMLWMSSTGRSRDTDDTVPTGYLWFLSALAEGEHLIDETDPPGLTERVRPWTRFSFPEQQGRMVENWLRWSHWYEARGRDSVEVWGARWPEFRRKMVEHLSSLDAGTWYTVASFAERFAARDTDALGTQFSAALNREHVDESLEARRRDVVRFVAEMTLLTACTWLNLVETARSRQRGYVFRLTEVGRWSLGLEEEPPEEPDFGEQPIAVQPNFDVLLLQPEPRLIWALSAFADLIELDRVTTFRLTEESIHRAVDAGATTDQVLLALDRFCGGEVPENVVYQVQEWGSSYRRARLGWGIVIQLSHTGEIDRLEEALVDQGLTVEQLARDRLFIRIASDDRREPTLRVLRTILSDLDIAARWGG